MRNLKEELLKDIRVVQDNNLMRRKYEDAAFLREVEKCVISLDKVPNSLKEYTKTLILPNRLDELLSNNKPLSDLFYKWDIQRIIDNRNDVITDLFDD
jgi:hypothetical protein